MKKALSMISAAVLLSALAGCGKKDSLYEEGAPQSTAPIAESISGNGESSQNVSEASPLPYEKLQKISELRDGLEDQITAVRNNEYKNLRFTDDFAARVPDSDVLYDLTFTAAEVDFQTCFEKFDKTFDREFGDVYTEEDKEKLYRVLIEYTDDYRGEESLLVNHFDKLMSGEEFYELYVDSDKAYLAMYSPKNGIHGLNHGGVIKRAEDDDRKVVALTFGTDYFDIVRNYLDFDSDDKFEILDAELSVKEAAEMAKKMTAEYGYSWGGSLEPDVCQVKVLDIGEGKYGFSFTMTPSYKGVLIDAFETINDGAMSVRDEDLEHGYNFFSANAFMMENDKFDSFTGGQSEYSAAETAAYDSVISFKDAAQIISDKFGLGMNLSVSRAELLYSSLYSESSAIKAFPVWKFRCHNLKDDYKYVIYVDAVRGNIEYYITDWWEV